MDETVFARVKKSFCDSDWLTFVNEGQILKRLFTREKTVRKKKTLVLRNIENVFIREDVLFSYNF